VSDSSPPALAQTTEQTLRQAIAYQQAGKLQDAENLYRAILRTEPSHPDANHNLGVLAVQVRQPAAALFHFKAALDANPAVWQYWLSYAGTLLDTGRATEALNIIENAMRRGLRTPAAKDLRKRAKSSVQNDGANEIAPLMALFNAGRYLELEKRAWELVERRPDSGLAWKALGMGLKAQGKDASSALKEAAHLLPEDAGAQFDLAIALRARGQLVASIASYRRGLDIEPDHADVHGNLGDALTELGQLDAAVESYRRALEIKPDYPELLNNMGNALKELGQLDAAVACYRRALEIKPHYAEVLCNLGNALRNQGRSAEAETCWRKALDIKPDMTDAMISTAGILIDEGKFPEAEELMQRAIATEPGNTQAWAGIVRCRKMTRDDDAWLAAALKLAGNNLSPRQEHFLRFAIGKYYDDVKDFEQAFVQYRRANELSKRLGNKYDRRQVTQTVDMLIHAFDREWINRKRIDANQSARPVFIVGMPRSGTSLAEQILASHPAVFGAGELVFWHSCLTADYLHSLAGPSSNHALRKTADDYLELLARHSSETLRVVDKMPPNFMWLGVIRAAFPNASIIHMQRNPIDTCLSIYFQNFRSTHSYANDLEDLAHYYTEYRRIMEHWHASFPTDTILHLPYEGLIDEQETWSRKLIEFIGLPWDERCIDFHLTERIVGSASNWQVRQMINRTSVERWRNYEKHVGPLISLIR
jgi:tetratricopeptide (TPR) repeat protein